MYEVSWFSFYVSTWEVEAIKIPLSALSHSAGVSHACVRTRVAPLCTFVMHHVTVCPCCSCINDTEKYPRCPGDNTTNIVSCVCGVSSRANCMTDGGPIDCSQSSGLPAKIGPPAKSSLAQLICHRAGQSRLHKLHRPAELTRCVLEPVLPSPTVH